jgi:anti-sigma factor RsiW
MSDFKDILNEDANGSKLTEEQLTAYLEGRLSGKELHDVEALLNTEGMESDALEGLQALDPSEVRQIKHELNANLQKALHKKRRTRRGIASQQWNMYAVVILILLILICFGVFWVMKHRP